MYKNEILFSIIITTYNNEKYIDKCLKEILRQYNNSMEIIKKVEISILLKQ